MLLLRGHRGPVRSLAFSPDGQALASVAAREPQASLWDLGTGKRLLSPRGAKNVRCLAFTPDGKQIILADSYHYLARWGPGAGTIEDGWLRAANLCHDLAFSPDGSLLAAVCYGIGDCYRVDLFRTASLPEKTWLVGGLGTPYCLAFSPDGGLLATGGEDSRLRLWNMKEKARCQVRKQGQAVRDLAFSPDSTRLALAVGTEVLLRDAPSFASGTSLSGHTQMVRAVAFSPDGRTLLSASDDGTARVWDAAAGKERAVFNWKIGKLTVAAFSPDGMRAAAGGDGAVVVWDVE